MRSCAALSFRILGQMEGHALQLSCLALRPFWGAVPSESHSARHFCLIRIIRTMRRLLCISWAAASPKRMKIITTSCTTRCQERHPVCCSVRIDGTFLYAAAARPVQTSGLDLRSAVYLQTLSEGSRTCMQRHFRLGGCSYSFVNWAMLFSRLNRDMLTPGLSADGLQSVRSASTRRRRAPCPA